MTEGGQLILREDTSGDIDMIPFGDTSRRSASLMFVPIRSGAKVVGILSIQSYTPNAYTEEDLAVLQSLADHGASALERTRTEEELRKYREQLEEMVGERTAALRESEEKSRAQYKGVPVPTYTWQKAGEDFVLVDYNDAAEAITQGKIADLVGIKLAEMYRDTPEIREEIARCLAEKTTIEREMFYRLQSTGESKHLAVKYAFVPPDLVLVHTEDITERVLAEEEVKKRSADLRKVINAMAGREVRMAELKGVIRKLRAQLEEAGLTPVVDDPLLGGETQGSFP